MEWLVAVLMLAVTATADEPEFKRFEFTEVEMAASVKIVLYAPDRPTANLAAKAAYARIGQLCRVFSDYDPESELRRLCSSSPGGVAVPVSDDLWRVLQHAQALSRRSQDAFDVTVGPVVRLWRRARRRQQLPAPELLNPARALVGYRYIRLNDKQRSVELQKPGMRLDLGGIAKGYAGDEALKVLEKAGVKSALIDVGGDIVLGDPPPGSSGWRIGVAPLKADGPASRYLSLANVAIATSGDVWQHVEIDGRRYSHIVDPRTGLGLTDRSSVTVIAPTGMAADGLASAVSVLGPKQGMKLIEATADTAALIINSPNGKTVQTHQSNRWPQQKP